MEFLFMTHTFPTFFLALKIYYPDRFQKLISTQNIFVKVQYIFNVL